jgi:hypothetical protein
MQTDVKAATVAEDSVAYNGRTRVKAFTFVSNGTAGSIVLRDGGSGGTELITQAFPAVEGIYEILIPDTGVLFETNVYVDVTNATSVTVFHG